VDGGPYKTAVLEITRSKKLNTPELYLFYTRETVVRTRTHVLVPRTRSVEYSRSAVRVQPYRALRRSPSRLLLLLLRCIFCLGANDRIADRPHPAGPHPFQLCSAPGAGSRLEGSTVRCAGPRGRRALHEIEVRTGETLNVAFRRR
jgi:hypothetical protein